MNELLLLEEQLLRLGAACGRTQCEALLAVEFCEFGGSGRVLSRCDILAEIGNAQERPFHLSEARCMPLGDAHALLIPRHASGPRKHPQQPVGVA